MCGIITGFKDKENFQEGLKAAEHRGPDHSGHLFLNNGILFGHTRLKILDVSKKSNQPFQFGKITLSYNGELWNYKELRKELEKKGREFTTSGDVEVIAQALDAWGLKALKKFDGMFGVVWWDGRILRAARDVFGEVPLYYSPSTSWAGSEEKILRTAKVFDSILLEPGHYVELKVTGSGTPVKFSKLESETWPPPKGSKYHQAIGGMIRQLLEDGTVKKTISDVPVCCLLSGGIDSSLILSNLKKLMPDIVAYTAVYNEKSADLKRAREVARFLQVELREVPIPPPTKVGLEEVIEIIEIPHKAQVEIGWACLHLAKQIRKDGFKVTFSGEGADEMFGSYGFSYHAIAAGRDWGEYRLDLFHNQHRKNFLRCNKIFMAEGIECRLPFLHKPLVEFVTSLPLEVTKRDKTPLKEAAQGLLPKKVINRGKVAFQDGLGLKEAIASIIDNPKKFYMNIFKRLKTNSKGFFF